MLLGASPITGTGAIRSFDGVQDEISSDDGLHHHRAGAFDRDRRLACPLGRVASAAASRGHE
jgi:hypothetical protein